MTRLLIIEDQESVRRMLSLHFKEEGFEVLTAQDGENGIQLFLDQQPDAVICDVRMPKLDGYEVLTAIRKEDQVTPFIMMTAHGDVAGAVRAMKEGASDYALKPFNIDELSFSLNRLLRVSKLQEENVRLKTELKRQKQTTLLGSSPKLAETLHLIKRVAPLPSTVLIEGETGSGKELAARLVHDQSPLKDGPFVAINCGAIPETLFESELFGHRKGAFTDAGRDRKGRFEEADGGTLFLDEIGEMPLAVQPKLLRALESGEIQKLGDNFPRKVTVRVVAATNKNLKSMVDSGGFREDLFFRLNVFPIRMAPLRERPEDIEELAQHFFKKYKAEFRRDCPDLDDQSIEALKNYSWPGNVRELSNTMERMALIYDGQPITNLLPKQMASNISELSFSIPRQLTPATYKDTLQRVQMDMEKALLEKALNDCLGNRQLAAKMLGIGERTLYYKLKELGLYQPES